MRTQHFSARLCLLTLLRLKSMHLAKEFCCLRIIDPMVHLGYNTPLEDTSHSWGINCPCESFMQRLWFSITQGWCQRHDVQPPWSLHNCELPAVVGYFPSVHNTIHTVQQHFGCGLATWFNCIKWKGRPCQRFKPSLKYDNSHCYNDLKHYKGEALKTKL